MEVIVTNSIRAFLFAGAAIALAGVAFAQSNGAIAGTVRDSKGSVVPGASVTVTNAGQAVTQTVRTNGEGDFNFPVVPPGTYLLTAEFQGFKKSE